MTEHPVRININPLHEDVKAYAVEYQLTRDRGLDGTELRRYAADLMNAVSRACVQRGAKVIGHIKAYIEHDTGFLHANTVGESGDVTVNGRDGVPARMFSLVVNSIIYGIGEQMVREATEESIVSTSLDYKLDLKPIGRNITTKSL